MRIKWLFPIFSGIIMGLSLSFKEVWWGVFLGIIPLYIYAKEAKLWEISISMILYNVILYSILISWLLHLKEIFPNEKNVGYLLLLSIIVIGIFESTFFVLAFWALKLTKLNGIWFALIFSSLYALAEWCQYNVIFLPFGWARVHLSLLYSDGIFLAQPASILGSSFLTLFVVFANSLLAEIFFIRKNTEKVKRMYSMSLSIFFGAYISISCAELLFLNNTNGTKIQASVIQTNFPGAEKWSVGQSILINKCTELTQNIPIPNKKNGLIVWPETAIHVNSIEIVNNLKLLAEQSQSDIILGSQTNDGGKDYNSCITILKNGQISQPYHKQILVPFGEYLPFKEILLSKIPLLNNFGYFEHGNESISVDTSYGKAAVAICYESIFPNISRKQMQDDGKILAIISNDSWFGDSMAINQLHANAALRAIENRRYLLRSGNAMLSEIVDPLGNVISQIEIGKEGSITEDVILRSPKSIYTIVGDFWLILPIYYWIAVVLRSISTRIITIFLNNKKPPCQQ